jgi:dihydropteroate synthase
VFQERRPIVLAPGVEAPPGVEVVDVETAAEAALAVIKGATVLRARDTRAAQRAVDVVAAIVEARERS